MRPIQELSFVYYEAIKAQLLPSPYILASSNRYVVDPTKQHLTIELLLIQ